MPKEQIGGKKPIKFLDTFAFYVFSIVMVYIFFTTFITIPKENVRFADTAVGFLLGTCMPLLINWAFRTSKSAQDEKFAKLRAKEAGVPGDENN